MNKRKLFNFLIAIILPYYLIGQIQLNRFVLFFPVPTAIDLDRGFIESNNRSSVSEITVNVNNPSNSKYNIFILTDQPYFSPINLNKPHHDLLWKLSSASESLYRPVSLQKSKISTGKGSGSVDIDFRLKLGWNNPPANYRLEVVFILETEEIHIIKKNPKPILDDLKLH
ncbi:MAG: hypothetical protein H8E71_00795 [Candidatus Marinimicrobia bacterium]|nr:hypothetical protein [Candidatus Neomarinimicrobiota bacterium]